MILIQYRPWHSSRVDKEDWKVDLAWESSGSGGSHSNTEDDTFGA